MNYIPHRPSPAHTLQTFTVQCCSHHSCQAASLKSIALPNVALHSCQSHPLESDTDPANDYQYALSVPIRKCPLHFCHFSAIRCNSVRYNPLLSRTIPPFCYDPLPDLGSRHLRNSTCLSCQNNPIMFATPPFYPHPSCQSCLYGALLCGTLLYGPFRSCQYRAIVCFLLRNTS